MRLVFYTGTYPGVSGWGGIGTYTRVLAHGLASRGHTVHVITRGSVSAVRLDGPVRVHRVRLGPIPVLDRLFPGIGQCVQLRRAVRGLVRSEHIDLVEFPNWEGLGLLSTYFRTSPVCVRLSTSTAETIGIDHVRWTRELRWDARRERWMARRADLRVTHSNAHRDLMAAELGVAPASIQVMPLGIAEPARSLAAPADDGELRILFLGRLERRKGVFDLLRAMPAVVNSHPRVRLILIGVDRPHCPGGLMHRQWAESQLPRGVLERTTFAGALAEAEVEENLRRAHVLVAPSHYESFGLILLEAMRNGVAVVSTKVGGIPEIVVDGETGVLVDPGRPDALGDALIELLADREKRVRLGARGHERFVAEFTSQRATERLEDLFRSVVQPTGMSP